MTARLILDGRIAIYQGHVLTCLREMRAGSVHCVVTSPPYWGLRDYGTAEWVGGDPACNHVVGELRRGLGMEKLGERYRGGGKKVAQVEPIKAKGQCPRCGALRIDAQLGLEPTLGEHLAAVVDVFREVWRVLRPDGVCWINYGDCYATAPNGRSAADTKAAGNDDRTFRDKPFSTVGAINPPEPGQPFPDGIGRRGGGNAPTGPVLDPGGGKHGNGARAGKTGNKGHRAHQPSFDADFASPRGKFTAADRQTRHDSGGRIVAGGFLKPKDLCLVPQRLAIALQDDGWWVRSMLPWVKRNSMPESITDRPANALEYVIMLTKSERYAYDAEAVKVATSPDTHARVARGGAGSTRANGGTRPDRPMKAVLGGDYRVPTGWNPGEGAHGNFHLEGRDPRVRVPGKNSRFFVDRNTRKDGRPKQAANGSGVRSNESFERATSASILPTRNFRNSDLFFSSLEAPWGLVSDGDTDVPIALDVPPAAFKEAHFATFPPGLIEPLIKAGAPVKVCPTCGTGWVRVMVKGAADLAHQRACGGDADGGYAGTSRKDYAAGGAQDASATKARILAGMRERTTTGFRPVCDCYDDRYRDAEAYPEPRSARKRCQRAAWGDRWLRVRQRPGGAWPAERAVVLDPFGGAGTTALVAARNGRDGILVELNPEYVAIAERRITEEWMGEDGRKRARAKRGVGSDNAGPLFSALL